MQRPTAEERRSPLDGACPVCFRRRDSDRENLGTVRTPERSPHDVVPDATLQTKNCKRPNSSRKRVETNKRNTKYGVPQGSVTGKKKRKRKKYKMRKRGNSIFRICRSTERKTRS